MTESDNNAIGIINVNATKSLVKNVEAVDSHISLVVCLFSVSSATCIPSASEKESAIVIVAIPAIKSR